MPPFNWTALAPIIGGLNPHGGGAFLKGWSRAQETLQERADREAQQRRQDELLKLQQAQESRAVEDQQFQRQQQMLSGVHSIRQLLEDPSIEDPTQFDQRFQFALRYAPMVGVDPGFVQTLRPAPDTFTKRKLTKLLDDFERRPISERQEAESQIYWEVGGQKFTPAQARQTLGRGGLNSATGEPFSFAKPQPPTGAINPEIPLDRQHAMALAAGNEALAKLIEDAMTRQDAAKSQPVDPQLAALNRQLAELRVQTAQAGLASGRSPRDVATFNQIAGAFERSPLIRASDRTIVLSDAIKAIEANPRDPAAQLSLAYSYIQALDTYQSAVREGELQNLGILGTRLQQWATELNRVAFEGAFLPPEVAKNIAANAKQLVQTIEAGRQRKAQEFGSRARVSGVGDMWDEFVGGASGTPRTSGPRPAAGANPFRRHDAAGR